MRWLALALVPLTLLATTACKDRRPLPPPCEDVNSSILATCPSMPTPLYCDNVDVEHVRCVVAATETTSCALLRQGITRCTVTFMQ